MNRVLELRTNLSMTQEEFSAFCGLARSSVARFEAGENIGRASAERIARACNVSVSFVLGDTNAETNETPPEPVPEKRKDPAPKWNVKYPPGVAFRVAKQEPDPQPVVVLSDADIARIAERVARINDDAKAAPALNPAEQQLVEEFRMLSPAQRIRVQRPDQTLDTYALSHLTCLIRTSGSCRGWSWS